MKLPKFDEVVERLQGSPPHFLAMDQSDSTHAKHMEQFGVEISGRNDAERKASLARKISQIRIALCTVLGLGRYFSGAIQFDSAYGLKGQDGAPLMEHLWANGVVPIGKKCGIDKSTGLIPDADMRKLPDELADLSRRGIHAVKIRNTTPDASKGLEPNADVMAQQMADIHATAAKQGDIIPILEPEFLANNGRSLDDNWLIMADTLALIVDRIRDDVFAKHPYIIKTSFTATGNKHPDYDNLDPDQCAEAFATILDDADIPTDLQIRFLSGGHSPVNSRLLYQACALREDLAEIVGTSFSRAILESTYKEGFNVGGARIMFKEKSAQHEILRQGKLNKLAQHGKYDPEMENATYADLLESDS